MLLVVRECVPGQTFILCNDNRWRVCPDFGDQPGCAKEYKFYGWAANKARRVGGSVMSTMNVAIWNERDNMKKLFLARLRPTRGTTMSDGSDLREVCKDSRHEAEQWIDRAVDEELAAGRYPGRADIFVLAGN